MKARIYLIGFFLYSGMLLAQNPGNITGILKDENSKEPISYATISIVSGDEVITGDMSDDKGKFTVKNIPLQKVDVIIEYIGFKTYTTSISLNEETKKIDLGTIVLQPDAELLEGIVIQAERSVTEQLVDRKVIHVGKDLSTAGATASEIMNNIPSVNIDQDGNISMRGNENVRILIDGKPTQMDPKTLLKQIPSNAIEKIELITNPSAKYNPEGMSGMINIVLKKNMQDGFNGSYNGNITFGRVPKYNQNIDLNYRKGKFNFFGNYGYTDHKGYNNGEITQLDDFSVQAFDIVNHNKTNSFKAGFDFYANEKNTFSFYTNQTFSKGNGTVDNAIFYPTMPSFYQTDRYNGDDKTHVYNAAFKRKFSKTGQVLDFEVNYNTTKQKQSGHFAIVENDLSKYNDNSDNEVTALQSNLDYVHPFGENSKLEVGAEYRKTSIDNTYRTTNVIANNTDFTYDVDIASAYATFGSKIGKWGYQIGARLEKYKVKADYSIANVKDKFSDDYLTVYPTAFLSYSPTSTDFLQLSASRRVDRPNVWQTRPIRDYSTPRVTQIGNPELKPQFTNSLEFNYTKILGVKGSLSFGTYYRVINDPIERTFSVDTSSVEAIEENKIIMSYGNFDQSKAYGAEISANYKITKWWDVQPSVEYYVRNQRGIVSVLNSDTNQVNLEKREIENGVFNTRLNNNFKITNNLRASLFGFYRGDSKNINSESKEMYKIDAGLRYAFWDNTASLSLRFNDVFNTMKYKFIGDAPFRQKGEFTWESQSLFVGFNYMFGTAKNKASQRKLRDKNEVQNSGGFF